MLCFEQQTNKLSPINIFISRNDLQKDVDFSNKVEMQGYPDILPECNHIIGI